MQMKCYTQATVFCQMTKDVDYPTAFKVKNISMSKYNNIFLKLAPGNNMDLYYQYNINYASVWSIGVWNVYKVLNLKTIPKTIPS